MRPLILFVILLSCRLLSFAQEDLPKITDSIEQEGRRLYRSEMASWYGTDIFVEKCKQQRQNAGGYLSYAVGDSARCIFFSKGDSAMVLATISFDSSYKTENANLDTVAREFNAGEKELYGIRKRALRQINNDTLFKRYNNTNLNLIPLVNGDERKVYVLTGPKNDGVVIFGNDYLLRFDAKDTLLTETQLHRNIILINFKNNDSVMSTMHSHLGETSEFITATDVCTLLLYGKFSGWQQHYVMSKNYVSIWDCDKHLLVILTKKALEKIDEDQKKRHPKN